MRCASSTIVGTKRNASAVINANSCTGTRKRFMKHLRVPVHELALMTALALRFVPTIVEEAQRIQRAQISRGANFSGGIWQRVHALVPMLVPLFVATFNRADELAIAMEARCYHSGEGRVSFRAMKFERGDWYAMVGMSAAMVMSLLIRS